MSLGNSEVNKRKQFAFDLNIKPVDDGNWDSTENSDSPDNSDLCTICLEPLVNTSDEHRTLVMLKCGHKFHLDCIGSAFNARRVMQCPNCKQMEPGEWRFAMDSPVSASDAEDSSAEEEEDIETTRRELGPFASPQTWLAHVGDQNDPFDDDNPFLEMVRQLEMESELNFMISDSDDNGDNSGDGGSDGDGESSEGEDSDGSE